MSQPPYHTPVLLNDVCSLLITTRDGVYVDGTLGGGGHTAAMLDRLSSTGRVIGLDVDDDALAFAAERLASYGERIVLKKTNFRNLKSVLSQLRLERVHGVLLDLGVSSYQLDQPTKGFSFQANERLDMRMDRSQSLDAEQIVNTYTTDDLADIFRKYGEEPQSKRIARAIMNERTAKRITGTGQLAAIIESTVSGKYLTKTLARVFQAIRIEVNNELENLRAALHDAIEVLCDGGRLVVISYHSLEDRMVKETFRAASATSIPSGHKMLPDTPVEPTLKVLTKKPVEASDEERKNNPRARSAKLRAAERV